MTADTRGSFDSERYLRQLPVAGWGEEAQRRLWSSRVGIIGAGGLGSPVSLYLAAAGVGTIVLCDYQELELSNLNRQVLYSNEEIGHSKVLRAAARLRSLNPEITILPVEEMILPENTARILDGCDLIIDCLDNIRTRHLLNRFCWSTGIPFLHAGIREFYGQLLFIKPPESVCLACFLPEYLPDEGPPPVVGAMAGVVGSLQAAEALKFLGDLGGTEPGVLRMIDCVSMQIESLPIARRENCPVCGGGSADAG